MPLKNGHMTPKERVFVQEMVRTGDKTYAATRAGIKNPEANAAMIAKRPAIDAEIRAQSMARLHNEGVPLAIGTLIAIAGSDKAPWNSRVAAAKEILAAADRESGASTSQKEPHEMTSAEIAERLAATRAQATALETVAADRARVINPIDAAAEFETIDEAETPAIFG